MPTNYTGVTTGITAHQAVVVPEPTDLDPRNAASVASSVEKVANLLAYLYAKAGLVDNGETWTALQTFTQGLRVTPSAVTQAQLSDATAQSAARQLRFAWALASITVRCYTNSNGNIEFTQNAVWGGASWTADDTTADAVLLTVGFYVQPTSPPPAGTKLPALKFQVKDVTTAAWTAWDADTKTLSDCSSVHANVNAASYCLIQPQSGRAVNIEMSLSITGAIAANTVLLALPSAPFRHYAGTTTIIAGVMTSGAAFYAVPAAFDNNGNLRLTNQALGSGDAVHINAVMITSV